MKKIKISLILNLIIVILVTLGTIFMFTGFTFMKSVLLLESKGLGMFRFFTVDSNLLIGISSLLLAIYEYKYIKNKINKIPLAVYLFKYLSVSGVTLTFLVTLLFLAPQYGFYAMYNNTNLLFHLIVPLIGIISYIFLEHYDNKYKYSILGIIPMVIYSIFYIINILVHFNNGGLTFKYDFYGFLQGNLYNIFIVIPVIYIFTYIISLLLLISNRKARKI